MMSTKISFTKAPLLLLAGVLLCCAYPFLSAAGHRAKLAATEYPPYYGQQLPNQGVITEIIRKAFNRAGYEVEIQFLPWKRALEATRRGEFDALYTAWNRGERTRWFAFSDPLPITNKIGFFKRVDRTISYRTIEDLHPYKIGTVRGYSNPPEFDRAGLNTEAVTEDRLNMKKLAADRIDLVLIDKVIGQHIIRTDLPESAQSLEWLDPPLKIEDQYLIFSKAVKDYSKKRTDFNRGLRKIIMEGTAEAIIIKHGYK
jgi:polar amino acid transport system substrate-binding protein